MNSELQEFLEVYNKALPDLLQKAGKYVLIYEGGVQNVLDTYEDALKEAYEKRGIKPFFVKQIQAVEQVQYFSRDLKETCHT